MLRELPAPEGGRFGWGYNGTGTGNAAAVILADAVEDEDDVTGFNAEGTTVVAGLRIGPKGVIPKGTIAPSDAKPVTNSYTPSTSTLPVG
ncbi:hypothetical protein AADR41_22285 [Streptomyces sp. CLV115]|uniref:hypothetical protein n=1 Tax=Streptomyces sp. CLV115 TaxID=3138502 RepID=UPI00313BA4A8